MMPIIALALTFLTLTLQAQQSIQLPPRQLIAPAIVRQTPVPQQSLSELRQATREQALEPKAIIDDVITDKDIDASGDKSDAPAKPAELSRLNKLAAYNLQTNKAPLADVLTLLADACQMSYVGLEKGVADNVQISVNISKNPYETLKYICNRYNIAFDYDNGVWHFALYNDEELIARIYHLRYNSQEEVTGGGGSGGNSSSSNGSTGSTSGNSSSSNSSSSTSSSGSSSLGGSSGGSSGSSGGTGGSASFSINKDVITKDIEKFLDFSSSDPSILTAEDFDVDHITKVSARGVSRVLPKAESSGSKSSASGSAGSGKVIYNSDNKSLYIMATRAQHQWIEKYLVTVDKPLKQILVETKVYETSMTPDRALGVNFTQNNAEENKKVSFGSGTFKFSSIPPINPISGASGSSSAILNWDQFRATINLLDKDSSSMSVQYPRQVTVANRPVSITSTETIPVAGDAQSVDPVSGGSTSTTGTKDLTTGTSISILPRIIDDNKVLMDISVEVSNLGDPVTITNVNGNSTDSYKTSTRSYTTQAIVESGYTLAIAGLKKTVVQDTREGVPYLSKMPVVGFLFRSTSHRMPQNMNLMLFVTPTILDSYRGGVKEDPQFIAPRDKDYPAHRVFQGTNDESYTDIMLALAGLEYPLKEYAQRAKEENSPKDLMNRLAGTENELKLMQVRLQEIALEQPNKDISEASRKINQYLNNINELRGSINKRRASPFI